MNTKPVYIIHDTDMDGCCGAWVLNETYKHIHSNITFIPQRAGINVPPEEIKNDSIVILVDRCYPLPVLMQLAVTNTVMVYDHHISALREIQQHKWLYQNTIGGREDSISCNNKSGTLLIRIDCSHSACGLVHYLFNYRVTAPWFVSYIEDRDIWKWELPHSREVNAFLSLDRATVGMFNLLGSMPLETATQSGRMIVAYRDALCKSIAEGPTVRWESAIDLRSFIDLSTARAKPPILVAYVTCPFMLISDLGDYILNQHTLKPDVVFFSNCLFELDYVGTLLLGSVLKSWVYSCRTKGSDDMSQFAKYNGGGGHANACGFTITTNPIQLAAQLRYNYTPAEIIGAKNDGNV